MELPTAEGHCIQYIHAVRLITSQWRTIVLLSRTVTPVILQLRYVQFVSAVLNVLRHGVPVVRVYTATRAPRSTIRASVYDCRYENCQKNGLRYLLQRKRHFFVEAFCLSLMDGFFLELAWNGALNSIVRVQCLGLFITSTLIINFERFVDLSRKPLRLSSKTLHTCYTAVRALN